VAVSRLLRLRGSKRLRPERGLSVPPLMLTRADEVIESGFGAQSRPTSDRSTLSPCGENLMRVLSWMIVGIATNLVSIASQAQTYDPSYPVCIQAYGTGGSNIDCNYTSLSPCQASASGLSAQCFANPYFAVRSQRR
jgi:Protein of unknown function (DUF3551)